MESVLDYIYVKNINLNLQEIRKSCLSMNGFIENNISPKHIKIKVSDCVSGVHNLETLKQTVPGNIISFIVDKQITTEQSALFANKLQLLKPLSLRTDFNFEQQKLIFLLIVILYYML